MFKWSLKLIIFLFVAALFFVGGAGGFVAWQLTKDLPAFKSVADYHPMGVTRIIYSKEGKETVIGEYFKERRYLIPYEKIPSKMVKAFVAAEDETFFEHKGISPLSILRAAYANFIAGQVVQGGSTITQQVVKSLFLTPERTITRKIKEVYLAHQIEENLTKENILYIYLNQIYLGLGAYGVQAAAQVYFNKDVSKLTNAEIALIAGMPRAPSKFGVLTNPKRAKERQLYVLKRMLETGAITLAEHSEATTQSLKIFGKTAPVLEYAEYYSEHIRKHLVEKYGEKAVNEEGIAVYVSTNPDLIKTSVQAVRKGLHEIDKRRGYRGIQYHIQSSEDVTNFLTKNRETLLERALEYRLFTPDGEIDIGKSLKEMGVTSDDQLLRFGELYEGIISGVDIKGKAIQVKFGNSSGRILFEDAEWATKMMKPTVKFRDGDVILFKLMRREKGQVRLSLEQKPEVQGALLSIDVKTGNILSMVGGYDFDKSEFNRAIQAKRQAGSVFKPILYSAALEYGFTPATVIVDSPIVFDDKEFGKWKPENFEEKFYGDTTLREALINSRNIATIKILQAVQIPEILKYAKGLGVIADLNQDLSIALGSAAVSLLDLVQVYSQYPRLGQPVVPRFWDVIRDRDGKVLEEAAAQNFNVEKAMSPRPPYISKKDRLPTAEASPTTTTGTAGEDFLDPRVAYVMTRLMQEVVEFGTGRRAKSLGREVAGKTGTTNENKDAWFLGFTPQVLTVVWVGFDEQAISLGHAETGANAALPIWIDYMAEAVKPYPNDQFLVPPGVVFTTIDTQTGKAVPAGHPRAYREAFIEGTEPKIGVGNKQRGNSDDQSEFLKEDME